MSPDPRPISLVAERAVRHLRRAGESLDSRTLIRELLSTRSRSEAAARRILETAFSGDPRLLYESGKWNLRDGQAAGKRGGEELPEPERVMLVVLVSWSVIRELLF